MHLFFTSNNLLLQPIKLLFIVCLVNVLHAQDTLRPTVDKALVTFTFQNPLNEKRVANKQFTLEGQANNQIFNLQTNKNGVEIVLVPNNETYDVHLPNWRNFATFEVPKGPYQQHEISVPFYEIPEGKDDILIKIPVQLHLIKDNGLPSELEETLLVRSSKTNQTHKVQTNKQGQAMLDLPIGATYVLSLNGAPNYYKFKIPNKPYAAWKEQVIFERIKGMNKYPSMSHALFNFIFEDFDGKRCGGETFWAKSLRTGKTYQGMTNALGIAQVLVPINDTYILSEKNNRNFRTQKAFLEKGNDIIVETVYYQSVSSKERQARQLAQDLAAARRDSLAKVAAAKVAAQIDSLEKAQKEKALAAFVQKDLPIPVGKKTFRIKKAVRAKVAIYEKQLKLNPQYFEDTEKPVLAVLQRNKARWKGKVVVTDITQSMNPYLEEVLIWHVLHLRQGEHCKYLFFNDGNRKMASAKKIGRTGGIYPCEGVYEDLPKVIQTMQHAIHNGLGGGEPPENDLEAVLASIDTTSKKTKEVILIADSYSLIRDMELLEAIKVPVHIILCGADEKNNFYSGQEVDINEQYLTIAHRTGGSLHTLKEDLWDLSAKKEGEIVKIGEATYILRNKQFIKLLR